MRICIIYDCLFPWTIGGAERWYRSLSESLAAAGHEVTYLTLRQWDEAYPPEIPGVKVIAVGPRMPLYQNGKRRIAPPLRFGIGVFWHLLRNGRRYDWLHMASFPYFSLLASAAIQPFARYRIAVDWFEVWSRTYWRDYLGRAGIVGWWVQKLCSRVPQQAFCFSALHNARLRELGARRPAVFLSGLHAGWDKSVFRQASSPATLVCAGRMIAEKRVALLIEALPFVLASAPATRVVLIGEGPEREAIAERIAQLGLSEVVSMRGFVDEDEFDRTMRTAAAVVQPSGREGYGLVVVESAARGVPIVVVTGEDNASVELVESGRNGFVAESPTPRCLADAILACLQENDQLRASTRAWYAQNELRLSLTESQRIVEGQYAISRAARQSSARSAVA